MPGFVDNSLAQNFHWMSDERLKMPEQNRIIVAIFSILMTLYYRLINNNTNQLYSRVLLAVEKKRLPPDIFIKEAAVISIEWSCYSLINFFVVLYLLFCTVRNHAPEARLLMSICSFRESIRPFNAISPVIDVIS